jgi:hypothetical protein
VPAEAEVEGNAYSPPGNPGIRHWQASYINCGGLDADDMAGSRPSVERVERVGWVQRVERVEATLGR